MQHYQFPEESECSLLRGIVSGLLIEAIGICCFIVVWYGWWGA